MFVPCFLQERVTYNSHLLGQRLVNLYWPPSLIPCNRTGIRSIGAAWAPSTRVTAASARPEVAVSPSPNSPKWSSTEVQNEVVNQKNRTGPVHASIIDKTNINGWDPQHKSFYPIRVSIRKLCIVSSEHMEEGNDISRQRRLVELEG